MSRKSRTEKQVFVNCPFDSQYQPIFEAIIFTIHACGFHSRCALEDGDSDKVRLDKIIKMISECDLGIHDLSRVDTHGQLPRFNMPLELGLFLGAQKFGGKKERRKACLVLEGERFQYQRFISDLAGVDPAAHSNKAEEAVGAVRKFLSGHQTGATILGKKRILELYRDFTDELPALLEGVEQDRESITFAEFRDYVQNYVVQQRPT
jgi:hypothetical protein